MEERSSADETRKGPQAAEPELDAGFAALLDDDPVEELEELDDPVDEDDEAVDEDDELSEDDFAGADPTVELPFVPRESVR